MTEDEKRLLLLVAKNLIYSDNTSVRPFLDFDDKKDIQNLIEKLESED